MQKVKQCLEARSNRYSSRLVADGMQVFQFDLSPVVHKNPLVERQAIGFARVHKSPGAIPPVRLSVDKAVRMA